MYDRKPGKKKSGIKIQVTFANSYNTQRSVNLTVVKIFFEAKQICFKMNCVFSDKVQVQTIYSPVATESSWDHYVTLSFFFFFNDHFWI